MGKKFQTNILLQRGIWFLQFLLSLREPLTQMCSKMTNTKPFAFLAKWTNLGSSPHWFIDLHVSILIQDSRLLRLYACIHSGLQSFSIICPPFINRSCSIHSPIMFTNATCPLLIHWKWFQIKISHSSWSRQGPCYPLKATFKAGPTKAGSVPLVLWCNQWGPPNTNWNVQNDGEPKLNFFHRSHFTSLYLHFTIPPPIKCLGVGLASRASMVRLSEHLWPVGAREYGSRWCNSRGKVKSLADANASGGRSGGHRRRVPTNSLTS